MCKMFMENDTHVQKGANLHFAMKGYELNMKKSTQKTGPSFISVTHVTKHLHVPVI